MPNYTTNYSLKKPLGNENFTKDDQNGNMDLIDQALKNNADAIVTKETPAGAQAKADAAEAAAKNASISHTLATAVNDFIVASGAGTFVKKTLAEVKSTLGLGSAAYTNSSAYATAAQGAKADAAILSSEKGAVGGVAEYDTVAAHLLEKTSSSQFGHVKVDGETITATGGVISAQTQIVDTVTADKWEWGMEDGIVFLERVVV